MSTKISDQVKKELEPIFLGISKTSPTYKTIHSSVEQLTSRIQRIASLNTSFLEWQKFLIQQSCPKNSAN